VEGLENLHQRFYSPPNLNSNLGIGLEVLIFIPDT
jgi:hypothetical protein